MLRRAIDLHRTRTWPLDQAVASVTLTFDARHKRRLRLNDDAGNAFLLDLPHAVAMEDGDGLALDGGGFIAVRAGDEPVMEVSAATPADLARLAWHIGNRHEPLQVIDDTRFRVRDDHVLADMLAGLGARTMRHIAPFAPERGAYNHGVHDHGTDAQREHGHEH